MWFWGTIGLPTIYCINWSWWDLFQFEYVQVRFGFVFRLCKYCMFADVCGMIGHWPCFGGIPHAPLCHTILNCADIIVILYIFLLGLPLVWEAGYPIQWKRNTKYKYDETRTSTAAERVHVLIYMYLDHWNLTCWIYIWWCPPKGAGYPELDLLVVVDTPAGAPAQTQHRDTILPGPCASLGVHIPLTTMQATALSVCLSTKVI